MLREKDLVGLEDLDFVPMWPWAKSERRAGGWVSKESKKSAHNYIAEGATKWAEAIDTSGVLGKSKHYPYQFLFNLKILSAKRANW